MDNYSAQLFRVDIQNPPPNFQTKVLRENSKPNENNRKWAWYVCYTDYFQPRSKTVAGKR